MRELWKAFISRMVYWLTPKPPAPPAPVIEQTPEPPLKPGKCECGHLRCSHVGGKGRCTMAWPPSEKWPTGSRCSCQTFILDKDDGDDEEEPETPSPSELEELYKK